MPHAKQTVNQLTRLTINKKVKHVNLSICQFVNLSQGFTLIEILVVLGLLSVTVGAALLFLTSLLRGSNQANVVTEIKQNSQAVLDNLDRQIRNAVTARPMNFSSFGAASAIALTLSDGGTLYIACFTTNLGTQENGWIGSVQRRYGEAAPTGMGNFDAVTNRNEVSGVDITCLPTTFVVILGSPGTYNPDIVSVKFLANQGVKAPSRGDFLAGINFQTTISLRRY